MSRRRILVALSTFHGGGEQIALRLAGGLAARGHRVDVSFHEPTGPLRDQVPATIGRLDLGGRRLAWPGRAGWLGDLPRLGRYLREARPDLVLAMDFRPMMVLPVVQALHETRIPVVAVIQNDGADRNRISGGRLASTLRNVALEVGLRRARHRVALTPSLANRTEQTFALEPGCVEVLPVPALPPDHQARARAPATLPWLAEAPASREAPVIVGVGRLDPQKRFDVLLEALALLRQRRPARLILLGEGPERAALEARIQRLGLGAHVRLPGWVQDPLPEVARATCLAVSSDFEGFGLTLIEALAVGTPAVSTNCVGPRDVLDHGRLGPLVPRRDPRALAQALERTLTSPPPAQQLRSHARRFTTEAAVEAYDRRLDHWCRGAAPRPA